MKPALIAVVLALAAGSAAGAGEPWYWHYQQAERHLVTRDWPAAESALRDALAVRPEAGCHLRLYGIKYRDYVPWYWMGVALQEQGRADEARSAFEQALADGVLATCPGTRSLAADARDRLARLQAPATPAPAPPDSGAAAVVAQARQALESALAAGAELHAPEELAQARAAIDRASDGDPELAAAALSATEAALWRARTQGPLATLLRREAEEELERARQRAGERPPGSVPAAARAEMEEAERLLASSRSAEASLAAEAAAERAQRHLEAPVPAPPPSRAPAPARPAVATPVQRAPDLRLVPLAWSTSSSRQPELHVSEAGKP